jgi:hypothetical protein
MPDPVIEGQTLMAFDFGEQRIGVAIGNTITCGARRVTVAAMRWRIAAALGLFGVFRRGVVSALTMRLAG